MLHIQTCSFHCHFNEGGRKLLLCPTAGRWTVCNRWKRFKIKINLIGLPASSTLAPRAPSWLPHNSQDDAHKLQWEQVSLRLKTISFFPRPYSVAPANSLTSNSLGGPLAYWPPRCPKKDQVHWGVFALTCPLCLYPFSPREHTSPHLLRVSTPVSCLPCLPFPATDALTYLTPLHSSYHLTYPIFIWLWPISPD